MNLVVDTNIFIAALLKDSKIRELIINSPYNLIMPEVIFEEIAEHKTELVQKSGLSEEIFNSISILISHYIRVIPNIHILPYKDAAKEIIGNIDSDDIPFFATSLAFNSCPIWSDDKYLKKQNKIKIIPTEEMISPTKIS